MNFKGYNGFPDLTTFDFECTDELQVFSGWQTLYKLTKAGTTVNFVEWIKNHRRYIDTIDPNNEKSWIKIYNGVYLSNVVYVSDAQLGDSYTIWLSVKDLTYYTLNQERDTVIISTDDGWTTFSIGCREFSHYGQVDEFAIALFNYKATTGNGADPTNPPWIYGSNIIAFFSGIGVSVSGSTILAPSQFILNDSTYREGFPEGYPQLAPSNMDLSSDTVSTWYMYSATPLVGAVGWIDSQINRDDDNSTTGGDDGNYGEEESEEVPDDGVPTISAISSGFVKLYNPTATELLSLRNYLYSDSFIDNVKKLISDPLDYIINLALFPCSPDVLSSEEIGVGGVSTGVSASKVSSQYKQFNCGSINIEECYGGFMDYAPMTDITIYLPFIGEQKLDINLVMHSTISLLYAIDFLTGDCVAKMTVINNHKLNGQIYFFNGNCACNIPMTAIDYGSKYISLLRGTTNAVTNATTGNIQGALTSMMEIGLSKPIYEKTGNVGKNAGFLANYTPFIMIERPEQSLPSTFKVLNGYKSNIGGVVSDFGGYSEFDYVKLDGIQATDSELDEIRQLLFDGVYV